MELQCWHPRLRSCDFPDEPQIQFALTNGCDTLKHPVIPTNAHRQRRLPEFTIHSVTMTYAH